jgi:hypothetical protein
VEAHRTTPERKGVIHMMRKLTATGLATLAVAGLVGTGAAFAATSHTAKPLAGTVSTDRSSKEASFRDKESAAKTPREKSAANRSHDAHASDRSHEQGDSTR